MFKKIFIMAVALVMSLGTLAGCAPSGFIKSKGDRISPLIYDGDNSNVIRNLRDQFVDENIGANFDSTKMHFIFNSENCYVFFDINHLGDGACQCDGVTVYLNETKKGAFTKIQDEWRTGGSSKHLEVEWVFLHENNLYYNYTKFQQKAYIMDWRDNFWRDEFYKFNLETGENEEIKITKFIEALQAIDNKWTINPDYKGEIA